MILEIAQVDVKPGLEAEFEDGVRRSMPLFLRASGFQSFQLRKVIETPRRYLLVVGWDTVEDHTEGFIGSSDFAEWRQLVGHCFVRIPSFEHSSEVLSWSASNPVFQLADGASMR